MKITKLVPAVLVLFAFACNSLLPTPTPTPTVIPTATPSSTSTPVPTPTLDAPRLLTGVNLAGADFGAPDKRPGVFGTDYTYPTHAEVDYFVGHGMNVFRLPFNWENLQQKPFANFQPDELARLDDGVS